MVVASLPGMSSMLMLMAASLILSAVVSAEDSEVRTVKKSKYRIDGLMPYSDDLFRIKFRATFEDHLNAEVAPLFSHGGERIRFEMGGQDFRTVFNSAENEDFDFIFTFPNMAGCLEAEFGASALLTMRNLRRGMELNMYGGVIFTRADRDDINSVHDLRDKRVAAVDILMMQHQWMVFMENGMDMMNDVGQVSCIPAPRNLDIDAWIDLIPMILVILRRGLISAWQWVATPIIITTDTAAALQPRP
jgi:hypothetical protein